MSDAISRLIVPGDGVAAGRLGYYMSDELESSCVLFSILGDNMDKSCLNWALGYPDIVPSNPAPTITSGQMGATCTDGSAYFHTAVMPSPGMTIGAISKRVSGLAPILSTGSSGIIGGYGISLIWSDATTLRVIRVENNAGVAVTRNTPLTVANANVRHKVMARLSPAAGGSQEVYCPTNGTTYGTGSVVYTPDTGAPGPAYIGGDRASSSAGGVGVHDVVIAFNARLSDKGLAELDALLSRIAADTSLTFGV